MEEGRETTTETFPFRTLMEATGANWAQEEDQKWVKENWSWRAELASLTTERSKGEAEGSKERKGTGSNSTKGTSSQGPRTCCIQKCWKLARLLRVCYA